MEYLEIGAFDAKSKLSELLRHVREGRRYTITVRGEAVADLIPSQNAAREDVDSAIEGMQSLKRIRGVSAKMMREWVEEGRR
jgi:prevent-host-death family protein